MVAAGGALGPACAITEAEERRKSLERSSIEMCQIWLRQTRAEEAPDDLRPLVPAAEYEVELVAKTRSAVVTAPMHILGVDGEPVADYEFRCEIPRQGEPVVSLTFVPPPPPPPLPPVETSSTSTST